MLKDLAKHIIDIFVELLRQEEIWLFLFIVGLGGALLIALPSGGFNLVRLILSLWWLWGAWILWKLFWPTILHWRQERYKAEKLSFVLLELLIPREVKKSPQAMEQVLRGLHALRVTPDGVKESYVEGILPTWFSLEAASFGGEVHFYIRCFKKNRNLVEAAFFSYYTDVEVVEVPDYVETKFPQTIQEMYERNYSIWGAEVTLSKESIYPIKMYPDFESIDEDKQFDPISVLLEFLGKVQKGEMIGIQILITPARGNWSDPWKSKLEELQKPPMMEVSVGDEKGSTREMAIGRTPGQVDVLEAVEKNISKPAFSTIIRFIQLSPQGIYTRAFSRLGVTSVFHQYSALNLNSFRINYKVSPTTGLRYWPHIFPGVRLEYRKQRLLYNYMHRELPPETWIGKFISSYLLNWNFYSEEFYMNVEGIATLFHPPTIAVLTAPHMKRVESRKTGPPSGLAIFGEEEEIGKYK